MSAEENERVEEMAAFFDARAAGYDAYQRGEIWDGPTFAQFYGAVSSPIPETHEPLEILDLGCGTGLELEFVFQRAPRARITGVDRSSKMLALLQARYAAYMGQITLVRDSYLTAPLGTSAYDCAISVLANHHLLHDAKRALYARIRAALKPGGCFVEGESVTSAEMEGQFIAEYHEQAATVPPAPAGEYHIDVPLSVGTQRALLLEAGFREFRLIWQKEPVEGWGFAVYAATA